MNERIKSLLAKAHLDVMEDLGDIDTNHVAERFAELIVKECCDAVSKRPYADDGVSIYLHPSAIIKKHFGVEE